MSAVLSDLPTNRKKARRFKGGTATLTFMDSVFPTGDEWAAVRRKWKAAQNI